MLMPSAIAASMAGMPASVAGILMKTFGRSSRDHSSRARASVRVGVLGEVGLDLDAGEAIGPVGRVVDRAQDVRGVADVRDRDLLVDLARAVAGLDLAPDELVVLPGRDRLGEDRRVAGQAADPVVDHLRRACRS